MNNFVEKRMISISQSLKSTSRSSGPRVCNKYLNTIIGGSNKNDSDFSEKVINIHYNLSIPEYYEHSLKNSSAKISSSGALISYSGKKTGRSPKDKRLVFSEKYNNYFWLGNNSPNINMSQKEFDVNRETAICYLNNLENVYVFDGYAGWDKNYQIKVRVISSRPYHCMFMHNMLIRPSSSDLVDIVISESIWSNLSDWQLNDPSYMIDISEDAIYGDDLN